ncbi:phosphotransferase [Streptomyces venezuelae]|uniref:Phosphotransferase n=1 Tax=Streptomyces venezuelae TaxID=54571 RepID=A0A5P2D3D3_STRVZ|nr:aminoglycoside phosphotransferase family protein [Streptomyces venezuelae]QES47629.1 phosphotransferase [Streptomyces venezuelae]
MAAQRLHPDEPELDEDLVRRLVRARFPQWSGLAVGRVATGGTSNVMYRLGTDMVVRLPRTASAAADVDTEHHWLPRLAPQLPAAVPVPLGRGGPAEGYPWPWSVYRWLDGETPLESQPADAGPLAADLAGFITALRAAEPAGGPAAYRSEPLAARDAATREALAELYEQHGEFDAAGTAAATAVWEAALEAPGWDRPPVWIHADLQPGNVLTVQGRLSAVIDFGCLGLGDPAVDTIAAWYILPAPARDAFRSALGADEAMWARGRGWALSIALMELRYYRTSKPEMAATARRVIGALLSDPA